MMNIVDMLLRFEKEPDTSIFEHCDPVIINVIVTELLSWMKLQQKRLLWIESGKKTSLKPLRLNMSYEWCRTLYKFVDEQPMLSEIFEIHDNCLDFKSSISDDYKSYAYREAYDKYNPQMIVG